MAGAGDAVTAPGKVHFQGLNSLRFLAAFFVVIGHVPLNQQSVGLPHPNRAAFLYRGSFAVCFFFALSGFLITYLLLDEERRTGDIQVRGFYLRRICRIWPLYFAVVLFGLVFYRWLLPLAGIHYRVEYGLATALLLYGALLPNLMNSLYVVGGILNPTWSIGIEEQFYLLWAPAVKRVRARLPMLCWVVLASSLVLYWLALHGAFGTHEWRHFVEQLKFHFMAAGGLCAWWLSRRREAFLRLPVFTSRTVQLILFALLLELYLIAFIPWNRLAQEVLQLVLYCWLIVNVAANPANVIPVGARMFDYPGTISYGIYMLHMPAVYATSQLFKSTAWWHGRPALYVLAYYGLVLGLTLLAAHLSYRWFERPFLRLKDRRFAVRQAEPPPLPAAGGRHRLLYLCDWLPPDFGAVGQYSLLFARRRAAGGEEVTLAGLSSTADSLSVEEAVGAGGRLRVVRRRAAAYDRANWRARALWTARTNLGLLWRARRSLLAADEILITGSPPFLLHLVAPLAALLRKRLTYRITDFHPECLMVEIGESRPVPRSLRAFHRLTLALRRRVDGFEVLGEDQRRRLLDQGIPAERIALARDPSPVEIPAGTVPLDRPPELARRCLLLYSGNLGVAHDYQTFLAGYRLHHRRGSGRVGLWLNATGTRADRFEQALRGEGLPVHRSLPAPLALLPRLLVAADAHLITLRDPFVGYVLPSKVYACLASRRDVLYVGSRRSDVHLLCSQALANGYFQVEVGDAEGLARALEEIADRAEAGLGRAGHG